MIKLVRKLRFLFLFFIILLFCLIKAFEAQIGLWRVTDLILVILIVTSILVIGQQEHTLLIWLMVLGLLQIAEIMINLWFSPGFLDALKSCLAVIFFSLMTVACLRLTLNDKSINVTTLFGSLSAYLFIGLAFAYLYLLIYSLDPQSLNNLAPYPETRVIYYSFITLTTVGFGDIVAMKPIVQCLSWMEAFFGQAYLAIFISQLVGRYVAARL